jgi:hypothetical protein
MAHGRELEYRIGRSKAEHVSMRLRVYGPGAFEPHLQLGERFRDADPIVLGGVVPAGWERIAVQTSSDSGLRLFALEPSDEQNEVRHHGFYIRGAFRVSSRVNNSRAVEAEFARPVDTVLSRAEALELWRDNPARVTLTVGVDEDPLPKPWERRIRLKGAWLYVHPENERAAMRLLGAES